MLRAKVRKRFIRAGEKLRTVAGAAAAIIIYCAVTFGSIFPANALPSFARQTGQPCGTCHTDFPGLTPYGRKFKMLGYTTGGGRYRTTPFPEFKPDPLDSLANYAKSVAGKPSGADTESQMKDDGQARAWVPPISMMAIVGYTNTQVPQDPTGSPYHANNNVMASPVSMFYGGAITEHIGAFAQVTYNGSPFGAAGNSADPYATFQFSWDNTDV